jgi:hypothetical protein
VLVAAFGGGAWWMFARDRADAPMAADGDETALQSSRPTASETPVAPIASATDEIAPEAVARADEKLPPQRKAEAPPVVPISMDLFRAGKGMVAGADLLAALVAARLTPVRFDTAATRERFLRTSFRVPPPRGFPGNVHGLLLFEFAGLLFRDDHFSGRLDDFALWIGAKGVYVPDVAGSSGPSPR